MGIDSDRKQLQRKLKELADLNTKVLALTTKEAEQRQTAQKAIVEAEKHRKDAGKFTPQIARVNKDVKTLETRIAKEEAKLAK